MRHYYQHVHLPSECWKSHFWGPQFQKISRSLSYKGFQSLKTDTCTCNLVWGLFEFMIEIIYNYYIYKFPRWELLSMHILSNSLRREKTIKNNFAEETTVLKVAHACGAIYYYKSFIYDQGNFSVNKINWLTEKKTYRKRSWINYLMLACHNSVNWNDLFIMLACIALLNSVNFPGHFIMLLGNSRPSWITRSSRTSRPTGKFHCVLLTWVIFRTTSRMWSIVRN